MMRQVSERQCGMSAPSITGYREVSNANATAMTINAMYPNINTLGERLTLYVEENFLDA